MRTIVVGDIHGCDKAVKTLIPALQEKGKYNPETNRLIFIGDYIDRGDNPRACVKYVRELQEKNPDRVIALMGNHEDMALDYVDHNGRDWFYNGYESTLLSYEDRREDFLEDLEWMRGLPLYYEDPYFVYVHAGLDKSKPVDQQDPFTLLWIRQGFYLDSKRYDKTIIFGHTPTMYLGDGHRPLWINGGNHIAIDTGCVFNGRLTALVIEDDQVLEYYQVKKDGSGSLESFPVPLVEEEEEHKSSFFGFLKKRK